MTINGNNPAEPKPASTVILIRQHEGELQVYLLKRSTKSGFMAGTYVFPGGTVDEEDRDLLWEDHADMDLESVSKKFGGNLTGEEALAYGVAAIRETFEEAGIFLAHRDGQSEDDLEKMCERRAKEGLPNGWLRERVETENWSLEFSRLSPWSHWITPKILPKRYDTRFFLAFMPPGQECIPDHRETTHGIWINPKKGLMGNAKGEIPLSPPTVVTLHELLDYKDIGELTKEVKTRQWGDTRIPHGVRTSKGIILLQPWDPLFNQDITIDTKDLEKKILQTGEPFSRLWNYKGLWRPVGR